jgi:hypothetical protein
VIATTRPLDSDNKEARMGWFSKDKASEAYGRNQRNADNKAGGEGRGKTVGFFGEPKVAQDEEAYVYGYRNHGDKKLPDWM